MNLIIGLAAVDEVTGGKQMQQLANGWMGRESKHGRKLRALGAQVLINLAARLDPAHLRGLMPEQGTTEARATS
jgi:hypothetical protein